MAPLVVINSRVLINASPQARQTQHPPHRSTAIKGNGLEPDRRIPGVLRATKLDGEWWNISVCDWQHQCSMQMRENELYSCHMRMMPSPGCEVDAAVVESKLVNITDAAMVTMVANGSYMYGPSNLYHTGSPQDDKPLVDVALECGLVGADRKRMRVRTTLRRARDRKWILHRASVAHEVWDEDFLNGKSLVGCSGMPMDKITTKAVTDANQLRGMWKGESTTFASSAGCVGATTEVEAYLDECSEHSDALRLNGGVIIQVDDEAAESDAISVKVYWNEAIGVCHTWNRNYDGNGKYVGSTHNQLSSTK
mmetsp:Transcript_8283/g.15672  ORF Transcript_8283/g.15672 Transcript_8283/m.15672 type:complete len:309 (-) Transcript_8283:122-1048(-)